MEQPGLKPAQMNRRTSNVLMADLPVNHNQRRMSRMMPFKGRFGQRLSVADSHHTSKLNFENTYRMSPEDDERFDTQRVKEVVQNVLAAYFNCEVYDSLECGQLALSLSDIIRREVKTLDFKRYKFIVNLIIGESSDQGFVVASRAIWDCKYDNYMCFEKINGNVVVVVVVHGIYFE